MLDGLPSNRIWPLVSPLLSDASRGVRIRAVSVLATVPIASQPSADQAAFGQAMAEFIAAQRLNADRPEARATLGNFYARRGLTGPAENEYEAALRLSPQYAPAAINLADLYRQRIAQRDTMSALDDMKQYEQITQANADGTKRLVEAFEPLYASLSPEQKKLADASFRDEHGKSKHSRGHHRPHAAGADAASTTKP